MSNDKCPFCKGNLIEEFLWTCKEEGDHCYWIASPIEFLSYKGFFIEKSIYQHLFIRNSSYVVVFTFDYFPSNEEIVEVLKHLSNLDIFI